MPIRFNTHVDLVELADAWPTPLEVPESVAEILRVSRALFVHSFWVYEFLVVATSWSLHGVEAGLRQRFAPVGKGVSFQKLIERAHAEGLLDDAWVERLDAGRQLRNYLSHPEAQTTFTVVDASVMLEAAHQVVAQLFADPRYPA